MRGAHYPIKVAILQAATVILQAVGKIDLLGALVTFSETQGDDAPTALLTVGFWSFLGLLCLNVVYPPLLLMFPDTAWARIGAALMDAILDLGYISTYLGMVPSKHLQTICKHFSDKFVSHSRLLRNFRRFINFKEYLTEMLIDAFDIVVAWKVVVAMMSLKVSQEAWGNFGADFTMQFRALIDLS